MYIEFENVVPDPLKNYSFGPNSVWNTKVELDGQKKYLLISESGRGKSSFISFLYGSRKDYSGTIRIEGVSWNDISLGNKSEIRQKQLAIVPQDLKLFPKLTILQNLVLKNRLRNHVSEADIRALIARFQLDGMENQTCGTLSLGQQQRVAIIRALIQPFDFLVMDEPFSHIDDKNIEIAHQAILEYCELNNAGLLLASLGSDYGISFDQRLQL